MKDTVLFILFYCSRMCFIRNTPKHINVFLTQWKKRCEWSAIWSFGSVVVWDLPLTVCLWRYDYSKVELCIHACNLLWIWEYSWGKQKRWILFFLPIFPCICFHPVLDLWTLCTFLFYVFLCPYVVSYPLCFSLSVLISLQLSPCICFFLPMPILVMFQAIFIN